MPRPANGSVGSRKRAALLTLACGLAAGLAFVGAKWLHAPAPRAGTRVAVAREAPSRQATGLTLEGQGGAGGPVADPAVPPVSERAQAGLVGRVWVKQAGTGEPVRGARVLGAGCTGYELAQGWLPEGRATVSGVTADDGGVELVAVNCPPEIGAIVVWVEATPDHAAASGVLWLVAGRGEATLALAAPQAIRGVVKDPLGNAVADIDLVARPSARGLAAFTPRGALAPAGRDEVFTRVGSDGAFAFQGLAPGLYDIYPATDGYGVRHQSPFARYVAGQEGVTLTVHAARLFRVTLLDGRTKEPVSGTLRTLQPLQTATDPRSYGGLERAVIFAAGSWARLEGRPSPEGWLEGVIYFEDSRVRVPDHVRMYLQVDGYDDSHARVSLQSPAQFVSERRLDEVSLVRSASASTGARSVRVRAHWVGPGELLPGPASKLVLPEHDLVLHGRRTSQNLWSFSGVPESLGAGAFLHDGLGASDALTVSEEEPGEYRAAFVRPEGLRIHAIDDAGFPVLGVEEVLLEGTESNGRAFRLSLPYAIAAGVSPASGAPIGRAYPVPAGSYLLAVIKAGLPPVTQRIDVVANQVATVTVQFPPAKPGRE